MKKIFFILLLILLSSFTYAALSDNLVHDYDFETLDGATIDDLEGSVDLIIHGDPTTYSGANCVLGDCYYLDGAGDYYETEIALTWADDMTWEFWLLDNNIAGDSSYQILASRDVNKEFSIYTESGISPYNEVRFEQGDTTNWLTGFYGEPAINNGNVRHVVFVFDYSADVVLYYVDNTLVSTMTDSDMSDAVFDDAVTFIGANYGGNFPINGYIDNFRVWTDKKTLSEIGELYNSGAGLNNAEINNITSPTSLSSITLNYPTNTTHYSLHNLNTTLIYNGSIVLTTNENANCSINNSNWPLVDTGNLTHIFTDTTPTEGNFSINYTCADATTSLNSTFWFVIDDTNASISVFSPLNNSNNYENFYLNISFFDEYLYMANINLSKSGVTKYYNTSGLLSGDDLYYNHTHLINISNSSFINGYYTLFMEAWDTHTHNDYFVNEKINIKRGKKASPKQLFRVNDKATKYLNKLNKEEETEENFTIENEVEFNFKQHKLKIRTPEKIEVNYHNKNDRLTLDFEASNDFDKGLTYKIIEAENSIIMLKNSPYNYHFIIDGDLWYDCEGLNVITADKINDTTYKIYYLQEKDIEESHSFGGLNYFNETYTFYIGHTILNYQIKDSTTNALIDYQNISFNMFFDVSSTYYNYTIGNGTLYLEDTESGLVDITISSDGYNSFLETTTINEGQTNSHIFYLTNTSATDSTILKTIDSGSQPIENATIVIYQWVNETIDVHSWGGYSVIQTLQTNFEGETTYEFIQETQYYRFKIYVNDILIEETTPSLIFKSTIVFQVVVTPSQLQSLLFLTPSTTNLVKTITGTNYTYNFSWVGGDLKGARLSVTKRNTLGGEQLIQEETSNLAFGNLIVSFIPNQEGAYVVEGWVDTNTSASFFPAKIDEFNFSDNFGILKNVGLFISYILILGLSLLMIQHPAGSIIGCILGLTFAALLGLLNITTGAVILIMTIGGLIIYLNKY